MNAPAPRPLPGFLSNCRVCKARVVFAITVASERNKGGKWQPFDPLENPDGRVALRAITATRAYARALAADETHDRTTELLAVPHAATCAGQRPTTTALPPGVADIAAARARKRGAARA